MNTIMRRVAFDPSGVQIVGQEFEDHSGPRTEFYIRLHPDDAPIRDSVKISAEARKAAKLRKVA